MSKNIDQLKLMSAGLFASVDTLKSIARELKQRRDIQASVELMDELDEIIERYYLMLHPDNPLEGLILCELEWLNK